MLPFGARMGLVDKSLLQSRARNGRAEGSRARCLGANFRTFSRCEFSQRGSPAPGREDKGITSRWGRGAEEGWRGTRLRWGLGSHLSGLDTVGKPAAEQTWVCCPCRSPSPERCCRGGSGQGSVLEMPPVHQDALLVS